MNSMYIPATIWIDATTYEYPVLMEQTDNGPPKKVATYTDDVTESIQKRIVDVIRIRLRKIIRGMRIARKSPYIKARNKRKNNRVR